MKKTELIQKAAQASGMTKKDVAIALDALLGTIEDTLAQGESVQITGFGSFTVKDQAARTGRNPMTNETIEIPASRRATFSASKVLKEKLNP
ncbi:MAG: HU family DNA-binding protein [Clostridia bacterium]|nr:HU family DNA-binding protein [Clostridia bacterium]